MEKCQHNWVHRKDGWVETCSPAICTKCGKYGCYCDFTRSIENYNYISSEEKDLLLKCFFNNEINGNNHELEKRIKNKKVKNNYSRFELLDI